MDKVLALHNSLSINLLVLGIFGILVSAIDDLHLKDLISSRKELSVEYVSAPRYKRCRRILIDKVQSGFSALN